MATATPVYFHGFFDNPLCSFEVSGISDSVKKSIMDWMTDIFKRRLNDWCVQKGLKGMMNTDLMNLIVAYAKDDTFPKWTFNGDPLAKFVKAEYSDGGLHIYCEPEPAFIKLINHYKDLENKPTYKYVPVKKEEHKMPFDYSEFARKMIYAPMIMLPKPKRIIYNDPATIVFWDDGTKTVVKKSESCKPKEKFNKYHAFCAALAKKIYGNNSRVNAYVDSGFDQTAKKKTVKKETKTNG